MTQPLPITVVLPVGPNAHHCQWLPECIRSIRDQVPQPAELLIIDDMHNIEGHCLAATMDAIGNLCYRIVRNPWRLGNPAAVNIGVAFACNDAVVLMAGDDELLPGALQAAWDAYSSHKFLDAFYYFGVRYSDGREDQFIMWGGGLVTKNLWRMTGGYSPQMSFGDGDAALGGVLMKYFHGRIIGISGHRKNRRPHYFHRIHDKSTTATTKDWHTIREVARRLVSNEWQPPEWGRYT